MKRRLAILELAKHREPTLLVSGQAISNFGDGVALVALTFLVLDTTHHSVSHLAWFAAARMTPLVAFLLLGGAVVDRFSRRLLLLISDSARAVLTGGLVTFIALGILHFWELMVFGVLFGLFDAVFTPCISAISPEIVPEDLLPAMNAVRPLSNNVMGNMAGPAVGGIVAAWSTAWAIGIDGATFVVSAAALAMMHPTPAPPRDDGASMIGDVKAGLRFVFGTRWLWTSSVSVAFLNAFVLTPMVVLVPYFLLHNLHTSKVLVGYSFAVFGFSGMIGALLAGSLKIPRRRIRVMWTYWTITTLSALVMVVATNYYEVLIFPLLSAPGVVLGNVIFETMMQTEVPRELLGRAASVDWFVSLGVTPIGLLVAGELANYIGVRHYFLIMVVIAVVPGLYILSSRRINEIDADRLTPVGEVLAS